MFPHTRSVPSPSAPEAAGRPLEAPHLATRLHAEVPLDHQPVRFQGRFGFEKIHGRSGLVTQAGTFDNLITDAGLDALGTTTVTAMVAFLGVGTGSNAPAVTDLQLQAEVSRTNASGGFSDTTGYDTTDAANPFHWYRKVYLFTETQANGNLTELGTFSDAGGGVMWSRQLFRDANGDAVTITKTSDEQLKVYYEWRVYPPLASTTQVITVNGVDVTVTNRALAITDPRAWGSAGVLTGFGVWVIGGYLYESNAMPPLSAGQAGSPAGLSSANPSAYVSQSLYRESELRWDPANANTPSGKLGSLAVYPHWVFNAPFISTFVPALTKTINDRVIIQVRISWARASV